MEITPFIFYAIVPINLRWLLWQALAVLYYFSWQNTNGYATL